MFESLIEYFQLKIDLSEQEIDMLKKIHKPLKFKRGYFLLEEGQLCTDTIFIVKGCLRLYKLDENGDEHVMKFGIENWWINDSESYFTNNPSKSYIQAMEDSEVILFNKNDFNNLLSIVPKLRQLSDSLMAKSYLAREQRIYSQISLTAHDKYNNFIKLYPEIFKRVPLQMIASYLGMSRKTLSRIRKEN